MISIRSIWSTGRSWNMARPAVAEPIRIPSISTSTWSDSAPRRNTEVSFPSPPWLVMFRPARPFSSSGNDRAWVRSISSRPITCAGIRLSSMATSVRVPVTTISSSSVASAAISARAIDGRPSAMAKARAWSEGETERRCCMANFSTAHDPYAEWSDGVASSGICQLRRARRPAARTAAAMPAASQPVNSRAGLRACELKVALVRVRLRPRRLPALACSG